METEKEITRRLSSFLKDNLVKATIPKERNIFVHVKKDALKATVGYLIGELKFRHLSTITGVDLGSKLGLIYHLVYEGSIMLSLKVTVSRENPVVPTITDLIPGAVLYEREAHDLLGVKFEGHPDLSPLILPEGWPQDVYPLRKEHKLEELRKFASERVRGK